MASAGEESARAGGYGPVPPKIACVFVEEVVVFFVAIVEVISSSMAASA